MSFGLLKHFKDSKSGSAHTQTRLHYKHVILGQDLGAILKLIELVTTAPEESVRLIVTRPVTRKSLVESYEYGVSQLRSPEAIQSIYRKYHNASILPQAKEAAFYKDGKFHDFGGRAKSMDLRSGEEFFTHRGYKLTLASLFSAEVWEKLDEIIFAHAEIRLFESIEKTTPAELIDKKEWSLSFKDYASISCENLYVSLSPKKFLSFIQNKEKVTAELVDVCTSVHVQAGISVTWKLNKEIFPEERTLFIPQSMTHEWGHFIVELEPYNHQNKEQICHILFLVHEEEPQAEELAAKIKLLKRVLDRVFPDVEKHILQEFIRFDEEMFISDVKDQSIEQLTFDYPTLKFLGQTSPMITQHSGEKFLSRALLN